MHLSTIFVKLTISKNTSVKTNFYRLGSQTLQNTKKKKKEINPRNTLSHFPSSSPPPSLKTVPSIVREERGEGINSARGENRRALLSRAR